MMKQRQKGFGASDGGAKIYVFVALLLVAGIFAAARIGPVYQAKWELEDKMEELMRRMHTLGQEGIMDQLQAYVDAQKLGFNVYDQCTLEGEVEEPGKMECNYQVKIGLPKYDIMKVKAKADVPKIPVFSN